MYSDGEFNGESDFAIKCNLKLKSEGVMDCAKLLPTDVPTGFPILCCGSTATSFKISFFKYQTLYSDVKFDGESDFAIKHDLKPLFDADMNVQIR